MTLGLPSPNWRASAAKSPRQSPADCRKSLPATAAANAIRRQHNLSPPEHSPVERSLPPAGGVRRGPLGAAGKGGRGKLQSPGSKSRKACFRSAFRRRSRRELQQHRCRRFAGRGKLQIEADTIGEQLGRLDSRLRPLDLFNLHLGCDGQRRTQRDMNAPGSLSGGEREPQPATKLLRSAGNYAADKLLRHFRRNNKGVGSLFFRQSRRSPGGRATVSLPPNEATIARPSPLRSR